MVYCVYLGVPGYDFQAVFFCLKIFFIVTVKIMWHFITGSTLDISSGSTLDPDEMPHGLYSL